MSDLPPELGLYGGLGVGVAGMFRRVLGPPADEAGEALRRWVSSRTKNVGRIVEKADRLLGEEAGQPGAVHPRVAFKVLHEGSLISDEVMQEYLAGLLVAGRTPDGQDDRATYYVDLVSRLTSNQIRVHNAIYSALAGIGDDDGRRLLNRLEGCLRACVYIPAEAFATILDLPDDLTAAGQVSQALAGLRREGLIEPEYSVNVGSKLRVRGAPRDRIGADICPSTVGAELFLWARGCRRNGGELTRREIDLPPLDPPIPNPEGIFVAPR